MVRQSRLYGKRRMATRQIIAIGGRPASGKTTLMRAILSRYKNELYEPVRGLYCHAVPEINAAVIGKYDTPELYAGTDRLSMNIQPAAQTFVRDSSLNILFEGDRLFNLSFLRFLHALPDSRVSVIYLDARDEILKNRYEERGSNQSAIFLKSRATKYHNILKSLPAVQIFNHNTRIQSDSILKLIEEYILKN